MATSFEMKKSRQKEGEIVMEALQDLGEPATYTDILNHISNRENVTKSTIKEPVKCILERGVELGFIQKYGGRYTSDATAYVGLKVARNTSPCDVCYQQHIRSLPATGQKHLLCFGRSKSTKRTKSSHRKSRSRSRRRSPRRSPRRSR